MKFHISEGVAGEVDEEVEEDERSVLMRMERTGGSGGFYGVVISS